MSMLHVFSFSNEKRFGRVAFCGILIALFSVGFIQSSVSAQSSIRIETVTDVPLGGTVEVGVILDNLDQSFEINGFDLLIIYHQTGLVLNDVQPGQLLNNCQWEYFVYRTSGDLDSVYNGQLTRIVAVADINITTGPVCNITQPGELLTMHFSTTSNPQFECQKNYISFFWNDCGDNMFSLENTTDVLISDSVWAYNEHYTIYDANFPSWSGTPNQCLGMGDSSSQMIRGMNFYGGSVEYSCADSSVIPDSADALVYIYFLNSTNLSTSQKAHIYIENSGSNPLVIGGFDLLLDFDPAYLSVDTAELSNDLLACGWEYFTYRQDVNPGCNGTNCQGGLLRLVAIADVNNTSNPSCLIDTSLLLATIDFYINIDTSLSAPLPTLNWIWNDCGDNSFANTFGDSIFVSNQVYDADRNNITSNDAFPSYGGLSDTCFNTASNNPARGINFYSSAINDISTDFRGDINLNYIANEIADYVLFTNYFVFGLGVFDINPPYQVAASDVNANGITLELSDLVYLWRIIVGDANPFLIQAEDPYREITTLSAAVPDTVTITHDRTNQTISFSTPDSVSALYFKFDGPVSHYDIADHIVNRIAFDTMTTVVLITPDFDPNYVGVPKIDTGYLFGYNGQANLIEVAATYDGLSNHPTKIVTTDTTIVPDSSLASVHLWTTSHAAIGGSQPVSVFLENSSPTPLVLSAFEFQIEFDTLKLNLDTVKIGTTLESMGWVLNGYRFEPDTNCTDTNCNKTYLTGLIIADFFDFNNPPQFIDTSVLLLDLMFHITTDSSKERQTAELNWIWTHCAVNSFSNELGDSMIIANNTFDGYGNLLTSSNSSPRYIGVPDSCWDSNYLIQPLPLVDFHSGVTAEFDLPWNDRGDINLNLIPNEIADLVLFYNYFIFGPQVFINNINAQIEASDVNANGIPLELADLVYLFRVIIGDALPFPAPGLETNSDDVPLKTTALYDTVNIIHDHVNNAIYLDYADSISALYFVFDSPVSQNMVADQISQKIGFDSLTTKVLIAPNLGDTLLGVPTINSGFMFSYYGEANLIEVEAAYNGISELQTLVVVADSLGCCQMRGDIDGDKNPISNITDLLYLVDYMFAFGPPPPCMAEANVDGIGEPTVDIADLMYLVDYMFISGPPPIPCQ